MGSGRGQQRRTQAGKISFTPDINSCEVFPGNYAVFLKEKNIEGTKVVNYYSLPRPVGAQRQRVEDWEAEVATQFLHDLVDTEALQVPSFFDISKLALKVDAVSNAMYASYPGCKQKTIVQMQPDHIWNDRTTMREIIRHGVIVGFCIGINALVREERQRQGLA